MDEIKILKIWPKNLNPLNVNQTEPNEPFWEVFGTKSLGGNSGGQNGV